MADTEKRYPIVDMENMSFSRDFKILMRILVGVDGVNSVARSLSTDQVGSLATGSMFNDIRFDASDAAPTFIGLHTTIDAETSDSNWLIYKFTYSGSDITHIRRQKGVWDDRASIFT